MKADFHIHSNYSDSTRTIEEIVQLATEKNLDYFAITDHDTVAGCQQVDRQKYPHMIAGIELSTYLDERPVHILGYFYDNDCSGEELLNYLEMMREKREERIHKILSRLKQYYEIEISYEEVKQESHQVIARPHIARAISKKYGYSFKEVFDLYLNNDSKAYVEIDRLGTKEGIDLLHRNNALVVLAHPLFLSTEAFRKVQSFGIDGVETFYPGQDAQVILQEMNPGLIQTGGSDDHGDNIDSSMIGDIEIPGQEIVRFVKKLSRSPKKN